MWRYDETYEILEADVLLEHLEVLHIDEVDDDEHEVIDIVTQEITDELDELDCVDSDDDEVEVDFLLDEQPVIDEDSDDEVTEPADAQQLITVDEVEELDIVMLVFDIDERDTNELHLSVISQIEVVEYTVQHDEMNVMNATDIVSINSHLVERLK